MACCSATGGDGAHPLRQWSVGSEGHPHTCALPCKFAGRKQGCSKGASCPRCHLCDWHGRGLDPFPKSKDGTPWVYKAPPAKKPEKLRQLGLAEAAAAAKALGGRVCQLGITSVKRGDNVQLFGVVKSTAVEESVLRRYAPGYDLSGSTEGVRALHEHLMAKGFTAACNSSELVELVRGIPEPDVESLRRNPMPPGTQSARIVDACIAQIKRALPAGSIVVGLYKSRARICSVDNASRLHKDDVLLTPEEVTKALFPWQQAHSTPSADDALFDRCRELCPDARQSHPLDRYRGFCADARQSHPLLDLPSCPVARSGDLSGWTRELIGSIRRYNEQQADREEELIFDNVNIWIPRDTKQITMLPLSYSCELDYPLSQEHVERLTTSCAQQFQALPQGAALVFFGQSVLHQALMGEGFDCGSGSLEGRYLVLTPRRHAHTGSLREHDLLGLVDAGRVEPEWE